jgi:hypothetical protein
LVWTGVASCGGNHPAVCGRHPSQEGNWFGRWLRRNVGAGFEPALPRKFPSREGCRVAAGWFPAPCAGCAGRRTVIAKHRYACDTYKVTGAKQSSAGGTTYGTYRRIVRQPWIASPHFINYVSQVRWRLRKDGLGLPSPVPAQCAGTEDGVTPRTARGNHPAVCGRHPSTEGIRTRVTTTVVPRLPRLTPIPSVEGCRRSGGVVSPAGRVPRPNLRL